MSIFYTFPYKNSADDFSPTLFIIEPKYIIVYLASILKFCIFDFSIRVFILLNIFWILF